MSNCIYVLDILLQQSEAAAATGGASTLPQLPKASDGKATRSTVSVSQGKKHNGAFTTSVLCELHEGHLYKAHRILLLRL